MILVLSGEGTSDIGTESQTVQGPRFVPGPIALIVDQLLAKPEKLNYSLLEMNGAGAECVLFVSESQLSDLCSAKPFLLPRGDDGFGNIFYRKQAYLFGKHARQISQRQNDQALAVFFRDGDGTLSMPSAQWRQKFDSILSGFKAAEFDSGVPMVPRPKSEAWMLCGLRKYENPNEKCSKLEEESGNDASPNSLKKQLAAHLGHDTTSEEQAELVRRGQIDPEQIDLPSFLAFRDALDAAFANAVKAN